MKNKNPKPKEKWAPTEEKRKAFAKWASTQHYVVPIEYATKIMEAFDAGYEEGYKEGYQTG